MQLNSVGYKTNVNIVDRPVTNHGIKGMPTAAQGKNQINEVLGPKRQFHDKSYFLNLLRAKNNEINKEINKFKAEVEEINKDNAQYLTLERK